jgi:hypothetical protein
MKENKMKSFKNFQEQDAQAAVDKKYDDNKKLLQKLHRKAKSKGGQVHVDFKDEKGRKKSGYYNGMMRMGAHTYAKIEPHKPGAMTALPIHQADNIRHVTQDKIKK